MTTCFNDSIELARFEQLSTSVVNKYDDINVNQTNSVSYDDVIIIDHTLPHCGEVSYDFDESLIISGSSDVLQSENTSNTAEVAEEFGSAKYWQSLLPELHDSELNGIFPDISGISLTPESTDSSLLGNLPLQNESENGIIEETASVLTKLSVAVQQLFEAEATATQAADDLASQNKTAKQTSLCSDESDCNCGLNECASKPIDDNDNSVVPVAEVLADNESVSNICSSDVNVVEDNGSINNDEAEPIDLKTDEHNNNMSDDDITLKPDNKDAVTDKVPGPDCSIRDSQNALTESNSEDAKNKNDMDIIEIHLDNQLCLDNVKQAVALEAGVDKVLGEDFKCSNEAVHLSLDSCCDNSESTSCNDETSDSNSSVTMNNCKYNRQIGLETDTRSTSDAMSMDNGLNDDFKDGLKYFI